MEKFNRTLRGYDPEEVNNFLNKVISHVEGMVNEMKEKDTRIAELESLEEENKILKDVSFELPLHGIILIQGENGQGKSTLLKLIKGDLKPNEGQIFFDGKLFHVLNMEVISIGIL